MVAVDPTHPVGGPPACAGQLKLRNGLSQECEATRHTQALARPDRATATLREFARWSCRILSWTRSVAGLSGNPPTRISRQPSTRYRATAADVSLFYRIKLSVVVIWLLDFCLFHLATPAPSSKQQHGRCGSFTIGCIVLQSQLIYTSSEVGAEVGRMGQWLMG